ncbi:SPFH domain-containing protein [Patescibacteria group bacterium AH-259-L05]|nr:SPFH domain-containing protein [Patescibacteria group bacterium AH-259-L05]
MGRVFEGVDAEEIVVIQDPIDGELHWYTDPGLKFQKFGRVTRYRKSSQFWFTLESDQGEKRDQSIKIRFNEGGTAQMSGSSRWDLPLDVEALTRIHTKYGSMAAVSSELVRPVFEKAVYMSGPLMSSKESYSEKRNQLINYVEDQAQSGVYRTKSTDSKAEDLITGILKTVTRVEIVMDVNAVHQRARQEESPLQKFGIRTYNLSLNRILYDATVVKQIEAQQDAIMQVQTAIAEAKKAEQRAITVAEEGKADAAKSKWDQEVIKAKLVTEAEQRRDVARLDQEAAGFKKKEQILLGQGEAERKRLVLAADGALKQKLDVYKEVSKYYADAISQYKGNWVPTVIMGGNGDETSAAGGAQDLIDLLTAKTAIDLSLDLNVPQGARVEKE